MSSITNAEAADFSVGAIPGKYFLDKRPTSQLFRLLPFVPISGHALTFQGVKAGEGPLALPWLGLNFAGTSDGADPLDSDVPAPMGVTFEIKRLGAEIQMDGLVSTIYGSVNDIVHELIRVKVEAVRDLFKTLVIRGDPSTNADEFGGLKWMTGPGGPFTMLAPVPQTIQANAGAGGTVLAGEIESLLSLINPRLGPDSCYLVMHAKAYEHLRRHNYPDVEYFLDPDLGPVPTISGVSVLIDNYIPTNETYMAKTTTSVYAVVIGEDQGLCGIYPAANEHNDIQVRGPYVKEARDREYYHVTWDVGLACFNSGAVARLEGVEFGN